MPCIYSPQCTGALSQFGPWAVWAVRAHLHISNGLPIWHSFPDITHNNVNNGLKSAILNLIKSQFFRAYPYLQLHILFYSLAIWQGLPDIRHIEVNYGRVFHF